MRVKLIEQENVVKLLLDSGAFSAWSKGEAINLENYLQFILEHRAHIEYCVNLDTIPGKGKGSTRTQLDVEESAQKSYDNWLHMREKLDPTGLYVVPVFHQGEQWKWLEKYIADGADYVGISPMADLPQPTIQRWLDEVFTRLTDKDGRATIKTHGFGVAAFRLLKRYPWFSCDAATWALVGGRGDIFLPKFRDGRFDYSEIPIKIKMSNALPRNDRPASDGFLSRQQAVSLDEDIYQYSNLAPMLRQLVDKFFEEEVGESVMRAIHDDRVRYKATALFLKRFGESLQDVRFEYRGAGKFV